MQGAVVSAVLETMTAMKSYLQSRGTVTKNVNRRARPAATPVRPRRPLLSRRGGQALLGAMAVLLPAVILQQLTASSTTAPPLLATPTAVPAVHPVAVPASAFSPGLAAGACVSYSPLRGNRGRVVFIDPGHGGYDPGATGVTTAGTIIHEKDLTLPISKSLVGLLRSDGYTAILSRTTDSTVMRTAAGDLAGTVMTPTAVRRDIAARVACANSAGAQVVISIHFNAFSDASVNGAETLYDKARSFSAANQRLATDVQQHMLDRLHAAGWPVPDRGILSDSKAGTPSATAEAAAYGHLLLIGPAAPGWVKTPSAMPGVLVEPLFISHAVETDIAVDLKGQVAIASGLKDGIDAYFAGGGTARISG